MKKCYLPAAVLILAATSYATNVTFKLNMSTYPDGATDSTSTVDVRGSFNGWAAGNPLTNDGGDYWSATIDIAAGAIEYKFTHTDDLAALTWESIGNRTYTVGTTDVVLDLAYFDDVAPYTATDSMDVFFRVNMGGVLTYAGEQVDVRGSFNGWSAGDDLTQETGDTDFWSGHITIPDTAATAIEYKFTYYDESATNWESIDNRTATISQDTTLAWKWFDDEPATEAEVDTFTVVFILNTATMDNITDSTVAGFYVSGSFNGWTQNDTLTAAGDYWSKAVEIIGTTEGADIEYKFRYTDGVGVEFWEGDPNRTATITSDTSLFHWWDGYEPFSPTDSVDVWFRVHMGGVIDEFDFVDVRGSFNGWSAGDVLTQETGEPDYWSGLIGFPDTGTTAIEYKFTYTDPDGGVHWEDNISNRTATISQDTTLAFKYFDDAPPPEVEPVTATVYWTVDMGAYELMDLFSTARDDTMQVRGGFNGWSSTAEPDGSDLIATNIAGTSIYELAVPLTMYPETEDKYKYYIKLSEESLDIITAENPYFFEDMGYENPPTWGGGDRPYTFEGITGQTQVIGLEYYNDIPLEGLIPLDQTVDVTFSVDMSPASDLGFDAAEDTVWFIFQDHWAEHIQGFSIAENSHHPDLILTDPDEDMVYSVTFTVTGYTPGSMVYVYEFGDEAGGYFDEGGGFAFGRYRVRYIQKEIDDPWPSSYEFPLDTWTSDPPLEVEDPPNWLAVDDDEVAALPQEFTVSQNYPNPFNPVTEIRFTLPQADEVTFAIYNVLGQTVLTYKRNFKQPGSYGLTWNGKDSKGLPVSSGIYLYSLKTTQHQVTKKMTLLR